MSIENINLVDVTPFNVEKYGVFCAKDQKSEAYTTKVNWIKDKLNDSVRLIIALNDKGKQLGYIEYTDGEKAWRPVIARNYLFINCIVIMSKKDRQHGVGKMLVNKVVKVARENNKTGVCVITSKGSWLADDSLFTKAGFSIIESKARFDLMYLQLVASENKPKFIDWTVEASKYKGLNLVYTDQCPWHVKSVTDLSNEAVSRGIKLKIKKIASYEEAQKSPTGFGTFGLIYDGKILADHYISKTRFKNILEKEIC